MFFSRPSRPTQVEGCVERALLSPLSPSAAAHFAKWYAWHLTNIGFKEDWEMWYEDDYSFLFSFLWLL